MEFDINHELINQVDQLILYPLKGVQGILVKELGILNGSLINDREFSIVQITGNGYKVVNSRNIPQICGLETHMSNEGFIIKHPSFEQPFSLGEPNFINNNSSSQISVTFKGFNYDAHILQNSNEWLMRSLGRDDLYIARQNDGVRRPIDHRYSFSGASGAIHFADNAPIHVISQSDLSLFGTDIDPRVFRPNIILKENSLLEYFEKGLNQGLTEERFCLIDGQPFRIAPCQRCNVINLNYETGIKTNDYLRNLKPYNISFGCYLIPMDTTEVAFTINFNSKIELY